MSWIGIEVDGQTSPGLLSFVEEPLNVPSQFFLEEGLRSFRMEVLDSQLFVKEQTETLLTCIDEIIGILPPRDVRVKGNALKYGLVKDKISP